MEIDTDENIGAGAHIDTNEDVQVVYLPLTDADTKLLPVHFLSASEVRHANISVYTSRLENHIEYIN